MQMFDKLTPEAMVTLVELRQTLDQQPKREYDREAKISLVKQWCKTFDGEIYTAADIDDHYGFSSTTSRVIMRDLLKSGHLTFKRVPGKVGQISIYFYHDTPVPAEERTSRQYIRKAGVTITKPEPVEKIAEHLEEVKLEADTKRNDEREAFINRSIKAVAAYLLDSPVVDAAEYLPALRSYLTFITTERNDYDV